MFTLLYVDDEPGLLEIGKIFLEQGGQFSVKTTTSTHQALEMLHSGQYDAIISDYQMPEMDGIAFLKRVRASGNTIPFIIFTGRGREEIVIQALNEGADFYLQKGGEPVSQFAELAHKIRQAVQQRRTEASIRDHERREVDIINFLPDATVAIDTNGVVIAWNRAMEMMTGVSAAQILGKGNFEYSLPFYGKRRPILIDQILKYNDSVALLYDSIRREGSKLFSEVFIPSMNGRHGLFLWFTASPLYNRDGIMIGAIESIRDITDRKCTESALRESEQRYRNVVEDQTEFICRFLPDGTHVFVNDAYCRYFHKKREEIIGHHFQPQLPGEDQKKVRAMITSLTPDNPVGFVRQRVIFPDKSVRWQHWVDRAIFDEKGTLQEYQSVGRDITDVMHAELALEESERRYRNVVEDQTEFICRFRPDGTHVFVNDAYCRYFGLEREEIIGHRFRPKIPPEDQKNISRFFASLTPDHPVDTIVHRIVMPDGSVRWQRWSDRALFDPAGNVLEFQSVGRDVTESKETEAALRESEQRYRNIIEDQTEFICRFRPGGTHVFVNDAYCRYFGLEREEIIGHRFRPKIPAEDQKNMSRFFASLTPDHPVDTIVHRIVMPDGRICWQRWSDRVIFDPSGKVIEYQSVGRDVTETKETEAALFESERKYRTLVETVDEGIWTIDADFLTKFTNRKMQEIFGYNAEEMLGRPVWDFVPRDEVESMKQALFRRQHIPGRYERQWVRKDGTAVWCLSSIMPLFSPQEKFIGLYGMFTDITKRRQAEDVLRQKTEDLDSRNKLISTLLDTIPIGIFMVEAPSGKPIIANREASRLLGRGILPDATEENLAEVYDAYRAGTTTRYPTEEMPIVRGMYGESRHIDDMVVIRPDGTTVQLEVFGIPVTDNQGRVTASLVSILDITERKRTEEVIRQANRKINLLTSITRHDVANQVSILRGLARLAMMKKTDPGVMDLLQKIDSSASTIKREIEFAKEYQELSMNAPGWFKVREIMAHQKANGVSLSCTCDAEIFADPMVEKVFFNLIDNAVWHGERVTTVMVSCRQDPCGVVIAVEDNGIGVPPDQKEMIFEKGYGKHTGFGLFLAREILAITGISIRETGTHGKGARFEIIVPKGTFRSAS